MYAANDRRIRPLDASLAGLQAGLLGVFWMLAWLGMSSILERRSFWTAENLLASAFYGNAAMRGGFGGATLSGLALYILLYSLLGALFGWVVRGSLPRLTLVLTGVVVGLGWYWLTFQMLWRSVAPLAAALHTRSASVLGHILFGTLMARFPAYIPHAKAADAPIEAVQVERGEGLGWRRQQSGNAHRLEFLGVRHGQ